MAASLIARNSTNVRYLAAFAWHRAALKVAAAVAPDRAVERAARLFTTPPRFPHTARELELLATGTRFDVATPVGRIAAWRFGRRDRPAVLLSHGWGGRGAQLRAFVPALLEAGYQPIAFDHAGHGHSDGRESTLVHFVRGLEAMAARVGDEGVPIAGVIGHSLGAAAAGTWLDRSGAGARAVLVAPPTSLERYAGLFARRLGLPERVRRAMQEHFERRLGWPWKSFELPHAIARVRAPALVIHDEHDAEVPLASGLALARAWPDARFLATRGLGHRQVLRDPAVVRDAVDFIAGRVVFAPPPQPGHARAFGAPAPIA
jgi:pimeloyl-ACP methyl ester carboxylesterase